MNPYLHLALVLFIYMLVAFAIGTWKKKNDVADVAWAMGVFVVGIFALSQDSDVSVRDALLATLIALWAFRLSGYVYVRNKNKPEDYRYAAWRAKWGDRPIWYGFWKVYMLQGLIIYLMGAPFLFTMLGTGPGIWWLDIVGIVVWLIGFVFETVSDQQLYQFKKHRENKGKVITHGLWKYSRHPNYFGEVALWWGFGIILFSGSMHIVSFLGAVLMTYFILYVTGIPMLEKRYEKDEVFQAYAAKTPKFFPWFPKG